MAKHLYFISAKTYKIGDRYNAVPLTGNTLLARHTLERCGAPSRFGPQDCGMASII